MNTNATLLVTGGAGFIGTHTCVELLASGYRVVVVDDLSNSTRQALDRVAEVAGHPVPFVQADLRDARRLDEIFATHAVDAVVHFAARKAVRESVQMPLEYYDVNVGGTLNLVRAMGDHDVRRLVFSSSCSIYGDADEVPITEQAPPRPTNPYARSKWMCEQILRDVCARHPTWSVVALRYFNPAGAHPTGVLGESPRDVPNNVLPYLMQVAVGRRPCLTVFGDDYPTIDGTGVRDYLHVVDVAEGHRVALDHLDGTSGFRACNLGTGVGTSVLELVDVCRDVTGRDIPVAYARRRRGDVATLVADPGLAAQMLGWRAKRVLRDMVRDAWEFQRRHPAGYEHGEARGTSGTRRSRTRAGHLEIS